MKFNTCEPPILSVPIKSLSNCANTQVINPSQTYLSWVENSFLLCWSRTRLKTRINSRRKLSLEIKNKLGRQQESTSVLTDSCSVGRMSSTLWIRSRRAIPTDCKDRCGKLICCLTPCCINPTLNQFKVILLTWTLVMYCSGFSSGMSFLSWTTTLTRPITEWYTLSSERSSSAVGAG